MEEESSGEDEDSMAMIATGLNKIFKSRRFDPNKYHKMGSSLKRMRNLQKVPKSVTIKMNLILILIKESEKKYAKGQERIQESNDSCME